MTAFIEGAVSVEGFDVRYWEASPSRETTVVYFHPAGGPQWRQPLKALAADYRVIQFEMPGFGTQTNDAVRSRTDMAAMMGRIIDAVGVEAYHLLATSMGAAVALDLATQRPEHIQSLILESPAAFRAEAKPLLDMSTEQLLSGFRSHPEREPLFELPAPEDRARFWPLVERILGPPGIDTDLIEAMKSCPTRTLVLFGNDDGIIPPHNGRLYRRHLPNSSLQYVYDAAHDIQGDRPEAFTDVVSDFLRRGLGFLVADVDTMINP